MVTDSKEMPEDLNNIPNERSDIPACMPDEMGGQDLIALFVLDDISNQTLNESLDQNAEHISGDYCLWLADRYDTLPDYRGTTKPGTFTPISSQWVSPFIGKTIPEAVAFMRNTPKPPKPLSKRYCVVLTKTILDDGRVLICKSLQGDVAVECYIGQEDEREGRSLKKVLQGLGNDCEDVQLIPTDMDRVGEFHRTFEEWKWPECYIEWREDGVELG